MFEWIADPQAWMALATLTLLEIVLGIDNIIFLTILVNRMPPAMRNRTRLFGLGFAMITRILLLLSLALMDSRIHTLRWASAYEHALAATNLRVPQLAELEVRDVLDQQLRQQLDGRALVAIAVDQALAVLEDGQHMAAFHTIGGAAVDHHDLVLRGIRDGGAIGGHNGALHPDLGRAGHVAHQLARRLGQRPRLAAVLEGGYHLASLGESAVRFVAALLGDADPDAGSPDAEDAAMPAGAQEVMDKVRRVHGL